MESHTVITGPYQQYGPPSQSSQATQLTRGTTRNQQPGTTNNVCQYRAANRVVQPIRGATNFTFQNGTRTSNWQTSAVPHQAISSNTQNPSSQMIYGFKVTTPQGFHQNSTQNSSTWSPSNMMKANTKYIQQDMSANWNRSVKQNGKQRESRIQNGNVVRDLQHCSVQRNFYQNVNRELTNPAFTTTFTSLPPVQAVGKGASVSASSLNIQTSPNQQHRQNSTQHRFLPSKAPSSYASVCESTRNKNLPSSGWSLLFPSMSQKTQQYSNQFNSTPNNREAATSSINSNMRARFADSLCKSFTAGSDGLPPVCTSSLHNSTMAPAPSPVIESHNLNASKSSSLHSGQTTHNLISTVQHIVDDVPQLMQQPESISTQRNKTHSSEANNHEISEMLTSINPNHSSVHSSPGRTGPRAIAVVQPLTQNYHPVATRQTSSKTINQGRTTTDESPSNQEKLFISPDEAKNEKDAYLREVSKPLKEDCTFPPRNTNQVKSNRHAIGHLVAFNDAAVVSSPDSAGPQQSKKRLCADDMRSEPAINIQLDQIVAPAAKRLVTSKVPEYQNDDKDKSELPPDEKACIYELSSLPTTPWTVMQIITLIEKAENIQKKKSEAFSGFITARELLSIYWDGDCKMLSDKLKTGWYKELITNVQEFCKKHLTLDSVILSQVKQSFVKHLQSFHVITDDEVYSELPYRSSWLNTNEQLDDIDKEFGFPLTLKHCSHTVDGDSQPYQVETVNSIPAHNVSEIQNKASSQTEFEAADSPSPNETESIDSSDPYYNFEIKILPPEEAKLIFEQVQSIEPVIQLEKSTNSPVEDDLPKVIDVTISDSELEKGTVTPLEEICCIARWKQIIMGSDTPSLSICQCTKEQSHEDCTDKTRDEQEVAAQKNDSKFYSAMVRENQTKSGENIIDQIQTFSWPELCNEVSQTIDFTGNDDSDKDPNNISLLSRSSSQSSIIFTSENKDDLNQMPDMEENREQAHLKCTESSQKIDSHKTEEVQMQTSATVDSQTCSLEHGPSSQQLLEGVSKCRKVFVDAADSKSLASNIGNVELILFGSATKEKCVSVGGHKIYRSSSQGVEVPMPPKVLSVSFSPLGETVPTGKHSVKQLIHKKWRKSFPLTRIKHRTKLNTQKCTISEASLKKAERSGPTNTEELPVSSQMRTCNRNPKRCPSLKRKRALSYGLKLEEQKTKKDAVTLKQPAVHERSKSENGSKAFVSLQEKNVLRFSVLPNTFSFRDGSNAIKDTTEHVSDKADLVGANDNSPDIPAKRAKGEWFPNPKKQYNPRHQSPVLKTSTVFHEYQKKYRQKMQPSLDE
ncbi:hypothetical protein PAMP_019479 [Pampus punctatissimus]